jgi:hypothetical protein
MKFALLVWAFLGFGHFHDFHTSLAEITYNRENKSLEVSVRVFSDDLEKALTHLNKGKPVKMEEPDAMVNPLLELYMRKNFALVSPSKEVQKMKFYGKEKEAEATWIFIEVLDCENIKNFIFYNSLMQELFDDQTNLANIIYPTGKKTLVFDSKTKVHPWPY